MVKAHIIESCLDCPSRMAGPHMPDCCGHPPYDQDVDNRKVFNPDDPNTEGHWRVIDTKWDTETKNQPIPEWCPRPNYDITPVTQ